MKKPLVSVIVANYNNAGYLGQCLDSIIAQTYRPLEILVGDDASNDGSIDIIREYEKQYGELVKGIFHRENMGIVKNRPSIIRQAKGDYLTTLDSDDFYYGNDKIEREMAVALHYKKISGKDTAAFSNIAHVDAAGDFLYVLGNDGNIKEGMIFTDMLARSCMIPRDFIISRRMYDAVGGYDTNFPLPAYEDWDMKLKLAEKFEFHYTNITGTAYRLVGNGLSALPLEKNLELLRTVFYIHIEKIPTCERQTVIDDFQRFIDRVIKNRKKK